MLTDSFSFYLIMLLLCHFIGDYYLQTDRMAQSKENSIRNTLLHSIFYAVPFFFFLFGLVFLDSLNLSTVGIILFVVVSHAVIDLIKCLFEQKTDQKASKAESKRIIYLTDQFLHLTVIIAGVFFISESGGAVRLSPEVYMFFKCVLFAVIIAKPVNISFKKIFEKYQPVLKTNENEDDTGSITGAGATIGILERFLMGILIGIGQYAALGLVVAAKSIARYDQISKNKTFAEYFLIGTLYSVLATLVVYFILFVFLA